jgi:hypothetical protein
MDRTCVVPGCAGRLRRPSHPLCPRHWEMDQAGGLRWEGEGRAVEIGVPLAKARDARGRDEDEGSSGEMLSSTKLGRYFELHATQMNLILQELGWIKQGDVKGWTRTEQGRKLGAEVRESSQRGVPYVVWPTAMMRNPVLLATIEELVGLPEGVPPPESARAAATVQTRPDDDFRERFPATLRTTDGHLVRSRGEALIDNWLYMQKIAHAVERRLPIEETVYCDFYVPQESVYIEYWGMSEEPKYAARMEEKKGIYSRHNLKLIELGDDDIKNLDDVLPKRLLKYGIGSV